MVYKKPFRFPHWPEDVAIYNPFCSCDNCHITFLLDCEYVPGSTDPMEQDTTAEIIQVMWDYVLS